MDDRNKVIANFEENLYELKALASKLDVKLDHSERTISDTERISQYDTKKFFTDSGAKTNTEFQGKLDEISHLMDSVKHQLKAAPYINAAMNEKTEQTKYDRDGGGSYLESLRNLPKPSTDKDSRNIHVIPPQSRKLKNPKVVQSNTNKTFNSNLNDSNLYDSFSNSPDRRPMAHDNYTPEYLRNRESAQKSANKNAHGGGAYRKKVSTYEKSINYDFDDNDLNNLEVKKVESGTELEPEYVIANTTFLEGEDVLSYDSQASEKQKQVPRNFVESQDIEIALNENLFKSKEKQTPIKPQHKQKSAQKYYETPSKQSDAPKFLQSGGFKEDFYDKSPLIHAEIESGIKSQNITKKNKVAPINYEKNPLKKVHINEIEDAGQKLSKIRLLEEKINEDDFYPMDIRARLKFEHQTFTE